MYVLANWDNDRLLESWKAITGKDDCMTMTPDRLTKLTHKMNAVDWYMKITQFLKSFDYPDLIVNMTIPVQKFFGDHRRFDHFTSRLETAQDLQQTFDVEQFIISNKKCFILRWKEEFRDIEYWLSRRVAYGYFLALPIVNEYIDPTSVVAIGLTWKNERASSSSVSFTSSSTNPRTKDIMFELYRSRVLSAPYHTNCINYMTASNGKIVSRDACYELCMGQLFKRKFGTKPIPLRMEVSDANIRSQSFSHEFEMTPEQKPIYEFCKSKCRRQECKQAVYVPIVKGLVTLKEDDLYYEILFALPTSPVVVCVSQPAIPIEGFVTDIASTFGIWLGMSMMAFLEWIQRAFSVLFKIIRSFRRRRRQQQAGQWMKKRQLNRIAVMERAKHPSLCVDKRRMREH
jgi:hypothetical protein